MKKVIPNLLKLAVSLAIVAYLLHDAQGSLSRLTSQPKQWGLLAAAWVLVFAAVAITFVRWRVLVLALGLPFTRRDAFRLGFWGYLLNFVSLGVVGGDLFKAVFIAREQPGRRAEAVASVVMDRIIGLYALVLVASTAVLATGLLSHSDDAMRAIARTTLLAAAAGTLCLGALFLPGVAADTTRLPRVAQLLHKLILAVRIYRRRTKELLVAGVLSLAVHSLTAVGIYLAARGLPGEVPSPGAHFVIVPLASITGILPLPVSGLGAFELVLDFLYQQVPSGVVIAERQGFLVAIVYRAMTILIALVGVCYFLTCRRDLAEMQRATHEAADESAIDDLESSSAGRPSTNTRPADRTSAGEVFASSSLARSTNLESPSA